MVAKSKITAREVANLAGVSVSAVSRAFRADSPLSDEKRKKIRSVALQLGYKTPAAKLEAARGRGTIAVVTSDLNDPFTSHSVSLLSRELQKRGSKMAFHAIDSKAQADAVMHQVVDSHADGVILISNDLNFQMSEACRDNGVPVVLFNRVHSECGTMAVCCDNYGGGRKVAARFVETGRRNIAYMGGDGLNTEQLDRSRGLRDQLDEAGLRVQATVNGHFSYDGAFRAARALFASHKGIDALFCANDLMAVAALNAARASEIRVPEDIALIGFDDMFMASWDSFKLTTLRQPLARMLEQSLDMLADASATYSGDVRILPGELIVRATG